MDKLTNDLQNWDALKDDCDWSGLLIGNGFSQNIWKKFGYQSLFDTASAGDGARLTEHDIELFNRLETRNFEAVLSALSVSKSVVSALEQDDQFISEREGSIRESLIRAVHAVHVPWFKIDDGVLNQVATELMDYAAVYCTNYDLLIYWAIMRNPRAFRDYFWSEAFDIKDTEVRGKKTVVHFLHGGLHLYRRPNGQTLKRKADENHSLLDLFATPFHDAMPLFVSEGTAKEKLASIYRSDYLSFVYARLAEDDAPVVIFGSSLSQADEHIVHAVGRHRGRRVAISMQAEGNIRQKKAALIKELPGVTLHFFDAATHPLGRPELSIAADA